MLDKGICFLNHNATPRPALELFNFADGQVTKISTIEKGPNVSGPAGFSVAPDGRWVLYRHVDQVDDDIMLVENF